MHSLPDLEHALMDTVLLLAFVIEMLERSAPGPLRRETVDGLSVILKSVHDRLSAAWASQELPQG